MDGENIGIQADLISRQLSVMENGEVSEFSWPNLARNDTYRAQHLAVLKGDVKKLCSFEDGLKTMHLIEDIRTWQN